MSPGIYILTISLLPLTAIIVFAMKYASSLAAARVRIAGDNELRDLIARHAEELASMRKTLIRIADDQAKHSQSLLNIDRILREVG
ncbi:hypothetical protein [Sphingopyxis indica]|uniref:Uncharacterized protein n=1 Tax=Sphingopyxis indica TaxID=436663 RepID=A0A239JY46_9SPHN|nr:hypothetical protein [Sphingopyxis indica]SNT10761.1 hypothetical protein SAMN06295955_111142 [Sphingopyxis indica]